MEIERKWLTDGWPQGLEEQRRILMRQGYITTRPTVRIRSEASGDVTEYVLCFKGAAGPDGLPGRRSRPTSTWSCLPSWRRSSAVPSSKRNSGVTPFPAVLP